MLVNYGYQWYRKTEDGYKVSRNGKSHWAAIPPSEVPYSVRLYFRNGGE